MRIDERLLIKTIKILAKVRMNKLHNFKALGYLNYASHAWEFREHRLRKYRPECTIKHVDYA